MALKLQAAAALAVTGALALPAATASATAPGASAARKHCRKGYTLKHGKCVKKRRTYTSTPGY